MALKRLPARRHRADTEINESMPHTLRIPIAPHGSPAAPVTSVILENASASLFLSLLLLHSLSLTSLFSLSLHVQNVAVAWNWSHRCENAVQAFRSYRYLNFASGHRLSARP